MARTSRSKVSGPSAVNEYLQREYVLYLQEYNDRARAGLVSDENGEDSLDFEQWAENFVESNF